MKESFYQWVKTLAVFYILFSAVLHLIPDSKYERYIRSFMGLLLIYILCTPVFAVFGRGSELAEIFFRQIYTGDADARNGRNRESSGLLSA